jgi:asparagine synthase (glutamine-hydrolysing)
MCGIAGYRTTSRVESGVLEAMVDALEHRGPDSAGFHRGQTYSGGMRRLRINDLVTGDQPLFNEDRRVVLLYNGEIYNSRALRRELEDRGHRFRTHSDGEVICHLYEECGTSLLERLDGMFAIALWDTSSRTLLLARDIAGEKPLYYSILGTSEVAFASEIKSLVQFSGLDLSLDRQALWDFPTFLWVPEPNTVYAHVRALPRGHLMVADDSGITVSAYANRFNPQPLPDDDAEVIAETRRVVTDAVESRLLSDVPVGAFLSSGLDSSIVATLAARSLPRLSTFCIAFEDAVDPYHGRADESAEAARTARTLGTDHHTIRVTDADFRAALPEFTRAGDQPCSISSGLGVLAVARAAREVGIKVLLTGDGADEAFGGYSWYPHLGPRTNDVSPFVPKPAPVSFQDVGLSIAERVAHIRSYPPPVQAWAWHYYAAETEKTGIFSADFASGVESSLRWFEADPRMSQGTPEDYIRNDRGFYLPQEMLRKADRMTMAHGVEGRVPFVAPAVLAHAEKLRFHHMVRDGELKWALRRAFESDLPPEVVRRPKHGFNVPIDRWLRGAWRDLLEEAFARGSALWRFGLIHVGSRDAALRLLDDTTRLSGHTLFSFIMLNLWLEQCHGNHR